MQEEIFDRLQSLLEKTLPALLKPQMNTDTYVPDIFICLYLCSSVVKK